MTRRFFQASAALAIFWIAAPAQTPVVIRGGWIFTATGAQEGNVTIGVAELDLSGSLAGLPGSVLGAESMLRPSCAMR